MSSKIGIGTAQFGMEYGISNSLPRISPQEIKRILSFAEERGMTYLDTSPSYGESEEVLGKTLPSHHSFKISTKTPVSSAESIEESLHLSLKHFMQRSVYALLVHRPEHLLLPDGPNRVETLKVLKKKGLVQKIGVSVYDREMIERILAIFTPDMIQLPLNLFDQRLLQDGTLKKLKAMGIEIQARSIFLQGLLLMEPKKVPPYFGRFQNEIQSYHYFLQERNLTSLQACIHFIMSVTEIDSFICGICSLEQLQEITAAAESVSISENFAKFALKDEAILNPSLWQLQ